MPTHCGLGDRPGPHTGPPSLQSSLGPPTTRTDSVSTRSEAKTTFTVPAGDTHHLLARVLPSGRRSAYLPSGEVILHQGAHDLLGRLGGAEVWGNRVAQHPFGISDPAWGKNGPVSSSQGPSPFRHPRGVLSSQTLSLGGKPDTSSFDLPGNSWHLGPQGPQVHMP